MRSLLILLLVTGLVGVTHADETPATVPQKAEGVDDAAQKPRMERDQQAAALQRLLQLKRARLKQIEGRAEAIYKDTDAGAGEVVLRKLNAQVDVLVPAMLRLERERRALEREAEAVERGDNSIELMQAAELDPNIRRMVDQLDELRVQKRDMSQRYNEQHPSVTAIVNRMGVVQKELQERRANLQENLRKGKLLRINDQLKAVAAERQAMEMRLAELEARARELMAIYRKLNGLETQRNKLQQETHAIETTIDLLRAEVPPAAIDLLNDVRD